MDHEDRIAIEGLFDRLARVEADGPTRDPAAAALIAERLRGQPAAPYYMLQTIVAQDRALAAAEARIAELEAAAAGGGGGLLGTLFGGARPAQPRPARALAPRGEGFLAGAAQTAMGVAGGMLIAQALSDAFAGDEAAAAELRPGFGDLAAWDDDDPDGGDFGGE